MDASGTVQVVETYAVEIDWVNGPLRCIALESVFLIA